MKITAVALAGSALLGSALIIGTQPASAALVTRCTGEAADVTIPGDLVVPAGASCELTGVRVDGNVTVRRDADLLMLDGSSVAGNVSVARNALADLADTSIEGSVTARNPFAIILDTSDVAGDITVETPRENASSFLYTLGTTVAGSVSVSGSEAFIESSRIGGDVDTSGAILTDVIDSTLAGRLTVDSNPEGAIVCESEIDGEAEFTANGYGLHIGGPGAFGACEGASYWGSSVVIDGNEGDVIGIDVSNNIIRGSLSGDDNEPAPTGSGNRVRGEVSGQFVDLAPAAAAEPSARVAAASPTRSADALGEVSGRRAEAGVVAIPAVDALS